MILCNVSRLSWEKRPLELIDLFLQVKGKKKFKLIIVGNGPLEEELNEKIRKNGLEKEVKIYPNVPYEKMWEIYEMSELLSEHEQRGDLQVWRSWRRFIIKPLWLLSAPWDLL